MAEPRQRHKGAARTALENAQATALGYQRKRTPRPHARSNRQLHISISVLILVFFVIYAHRYGPKKPVYEAGGTRLPEWYAVCSKEGNKVYTVPVEGGVGGVECVVVKGQHVVDAGSLGKVRRRYGDKATIGGVDHSPAELRKAGGIRIVFLPPGHSLTPGLTDSHGHSLEYGHTRALSLVGTASKEEIVGRVEDHVQNRWDKESWIEGMGWDQNRWPVKEFPTAADLESSPILRGLPISLARIDVHAIWVSQAILDKLGDLPNHVEGGQIVRDKSGKPTGVFLDNAMDLVEAIKPGWTDTQREKYLDRMMDDALSHGLTGVHDARVPLEDYNFYKRMDAEDRLKLRFYAMVFCDDPDRFCGDDFEKFAGDHLTVRSVKLFGDGALGSRGAALLEDYSDKPGWKGFLLRPEDQWKQLIKDWFAHGWQVNVHAIGDRAVHVVLNAFEEIVKSGVASERLFRLEHSQIMTLDDLDRAVRLGVIASYQPTHATSDMRYAEDRLGPERIKGAYACKSYLNKGGRIALGSDFPVESIDPLKGYYAAVTRLDENGSSPHGKGGWYPQEKLSREEALRGMTVDAAYASFSNNTGSLTPGMKFDAVVWDDDLVTVPDDEILQVRVKGTIVNGQLAFGRI